jgi:GT2 family glycosyltransferase
LAAVKVPVALFSYNRPNHVRRALDTLSGCRRFKEVQVVVFNDGPKGPNDRDGVEAARDEVRRRQKELGLEIVERPENLGLARSIVAGVTELCAKFGRVIVLEDDLAVAPDFLDYMLTALDRYENNADVYQISGYMFPVELPAQPDAFFLPLTTTWGWATWERAWRQFDRHAAGYEQDLRDSRVRQAFDLEGAYPYSQLLRQKLAGKNDSWGILWWWTVFKNHGLVLHPRRTLTWVGGFDGSGTHCRDETVLQQVDCHDIDQPSLSGRMMFPPEPEIDEAAFLRVKAFLKEHHGVGLGRRIRRLVGLLQRRLTGAGSVRVS